MGWSPMAAVASEGKALALLEATMGRNARALLDRLLLDGDREA